MEGLVLHYNWTGGCEIVEIVGESARSYTIKFRPDLNNTDYALRQVDRTVQWSKRQDYRKISPLLAKLMFPEVYKKLYEYIYR